MNKKENIQTKKSNSEVKARKGFKFYVGLVLSLALTLTFGITAFAAGDPVAVVNNLSTFIFGLIRAVGLILLGFGIVQVGLSLKSHDPHREQTASLLLPVVLL